MTRFLISVALMLILALIVTFAWPQEAGSAPSYTIEPVFYEPTPVIPAVVQPFYSTIYVGRENEKIHAWVTAYSPTETCPGKLAKNCVDASGTRPVDGKSVACPRKLPFGTRLFIESVGTRTCTDRLARRFDQRFNLFVEDYQEAKEWGKKWLEVEIIK